MRRRFCEGGSLIVCGYIGDVAQAYVGLAGLSYLLYKFSAAQIAGGVITDFQKGMEGSSAVFGLGNSEYGVTGGGIVHHFDFLLIGAGSLVYGKTGAVAKGGGIGQLIDGGFPYR